MTLAPPLTREDAAVAVPNPLLHLRTKRNLSRSQMAARLRTSKATVQFAEQGCYDSPPIPYRKFISPEIYTEYRTFRREKRRANFKPDDFPSSCTNVHQLIKHLNLTPFQFADRICVQPAEIYRLMNTPTTNHIPTNLMQAFIDVEAPLDWIKNFHKGGVEVP